MSGDELQGSLGPFKGTVKGPVAVIVAVILLGFGAVLYTMDKAAANIVVLRAVTLGEHMAIVDGQRAIVDGQRQLMCMTALPVPIRPAAVAYTQGGKTSSVCDYVLHVYLAGRP